MRLARAARPTVPEPVASGPAARGAVMLVTLESAFDADAERIALSSALDGGLPLRLVDLIDMAFAPISGLYGRRSLATVEERDALRHTAETAAALGLEVAILHVRSRRPARALAEVVAEERPTLLVVGPSRVRDSRRLRGVVRQACESSCLVWIADGLPT
jgi:nucleotide-binding universal stress UspA family protein